MWEPFCLICGFGRMRRQEEWLAHMAGHNAARGGHSSSPTTGAPPSMEGRGYYEEDAPGYDEAS